MMRMKNIMRTGAVVVVFLTAIIGVVFNSKAALATTSADSTFSQLIREIDCSHTVYSRAVGQVNDVECDVFAPKYDHSVIKDNGYPVIYGVYDAVHTVIDPVTGVHKLAIEFAGRVFVLGVDPELTVNGNAWVLDLSNWPNTHPGDTTLVIERGKTYLGEITSSTRAYGSALQINHAVPFTITIPPRILPSTPPVIPPAVPDVSAAATGIKSGKDLANTGANMWFMVIAALGMIIIAFILLIRNRRGGSHEP
ncbi:MAG: LPXTG cell wall anchor domain-containing protein [Candidatus Saccharimonas sp.]|nr:MAG: LPXTG cell wall anchor domain-containing protein [Candidatus Saccharimonas sp.]